MTKISHLFVTHSEVEARHVLIVVLLEPVVEVLGVVCGVSFAVSGHAENGDGVGDLRQTGKLALQQQQRYSGGGE